MQVFIILYLWALFGFSPYINFRVSSQRFICKEMRISQDITDVVD